MVESSKEEITVTPPWTSDASDNEHISMNIEDSLEEKIATWVAHSSAIFKSQQIDEPELTIQEKKNIAFNLLNKSHSQFLSRFGKYLNHELLEYFSTNNDDYEIIYHINKLKRYFNGKTRQLDRKNRRFEALKTLINEGEYFSEVSMMKRNPLLYENLIGQYLTEKQKKSRDNIDTSNITFLNILLEGIERDQIKKLREDQENAEDEVFEENDSDSDSEDEKIEKCQRVDANTLSWGEFSNTVARNIQEKNGKQTNITLNNLTIEEKNMLRHEFVTQMYQSFLDGKDTDFDYSLVDDNETYDNVDLRTQDEEEQYFDSETPEWVDEPEIKKEQDESEDELDKYMKCLKVK